jgi:hypothetical protein
MGILHAAADGTLRHVWTNKLEREHAALGVTPDVDATSTLTLDSDTNAALFADVSATILAYRLSADGGLTKDGQPVAINPPAPPPPPAVDPAAIGAALASLPDDQPLTKADLAPLLALFGAGVRSA